MVAGAALLAGTWRFADERGKARKRREPRRGTAHTGEVAMGATVCTVAATRIEELGVDAVDQGILERALQRDGDQLAYVTRGEVDERLREHLARACSGGGPALVCLYGPARAGKSRSMVEALKAQLPSAAIVAPDRTRESLQATLDSDLLRQAADQHGGVVILWLDDLERFARVGDSGLDGSRLAKLKEAQPGLVAAATAGGVRPETLSADQLASLDALLDHGVIEELHPAFATPAERTALAGVVPRDLAEEMYGGLGAVVVAGRRRGADPPRQEPSRLQ